MSPLNSAPAVVAGGARGIGEAIANELALQPWVSEVVVADILAAEAEAVADRINARGVRARAYGVDVTDAASMNALVAATTGARYLAISVGITHIGSSLETDSETFRRILDVNLIGPFALARLYARQMSAGGGGSIVGLASVAASAARLNQAAYAASKAGLRQALRVLGLEVAANVRINTVSPGATDTQMTRDFLRMHAPDADLAAEDLATGSLDTYRARIPVGRVATPAEIAAAVVFLLSPAASHITLQDLIVDGGELLGV